MNLAFEFDSITITPGTDLVYELSKRGKDSWYPASLPPLQTPFGLKLILQRAVIGGAQLLNEAADEEPKKSEPEPHRESRLILS